MAGVESNPGPPPPWFCAGCTRPIYKNQGSVRCNTCLEWFHCYKGPNNNCSGLSDIDNYTTDYKCRQCGILPTPALPPQPPTSQPPARQPTARQPPARQPPARQLPARRPPARQPTARQPPTNQPPPTLLAAGQQPCALPVSSSSSSAPDCLNILQFNCNGLYSRLEEIKYFLSFADIKIAVLQETKLSSSSRSPIFPGYAVIRKDRTRNAGGGLITLVHNSLAFSERPVSSSDAVCEMQNVFIALHNSHVDLFNVYIPPASSSPPGYRPSLAGLLAGDSRLILGDVNAHDALWYSPTQDARGTAIADEINDSDFGVLNEDGVATRLPVAGDPSSPDISIASPDLLACASWSTHCTLGSDHLPIIVSLPISSSPVLSDRRTFINIRKANWPAFERSVESAMRQRPLCGNIHVGLRDFNNVILRAVKKHVPTGRVTNYSPGFPKEARDLAASRDAIRAADPQAAELRELNEKIEKIANDHKRDRWREHVESLDIRSHPAQLWGTLKGLTQGAAAPSNSAITFLGKPTFDTRDIAAAFNKQFTTIRQHTSKKSTRLVKRRILKLPLTSPLVFTPEEVSNAIKISKASRALGPDNISMLYLKHLGPAAISHLTHIYNLSLASCIIPAKWKTSTIIPLLKPGKSHADSLSYRPISLLCPAVKVLERLILPTLNSHIHLKPHQHGFRPAHSTSTALHIITDQIAHGFNQPKPPHRTVLVALDLSKAFDSVDLDVMTDLLGRSLPGSLARWLNCYLRGRQSRVSFRNTLSASRNVKTGVPQGSVISPSLFNAYMADLPQPPPSVNLVTYADDITVLASGPSLPPLYDPLNEYLEQLHSFLLERSLLISPSKSSVTLFSSDSHQYNVHPTILLNGTQLPLAQHPKILGVHLDPMLTLNRHAAAQAATSKRRTNVLKALSGTSWGQDTETLVITYRATSKAALEYAAPVIEPLLSNSSWLKLERAENIALRVATGCTAMTGTDHLHNETQVVPVRRHCQLLASQYLRKTLLPSHPAHHILHRPPPRRRMKNSLVESNRPIMDPLLHGPVTAEQITAMTAALHRETVADILATRAANRVLGEPPPLVNFRMLERRANLPRRTRVLLSQLRSGFSPFLHSYRARVSPGSPDDCPDCGTARHDTAHLFECPARPTDLRPIDLWLRPAEVAAFLTI